MTRCILFVFFGGIFDTGKKKPSRYENNIWAEPRSQGMKQVVKHHTTGLSCLRLRIYHICFKTSSNIFLQKSSRLICSMSDNFVNVKLPHSMFSVPDELTLPLNRSEAEADKETVGQVVQNPVRPLFFEPTKSLCTNISSQQLPVIVGSPVRLVSELPVAASLELSSTIQESPTNLGTKASMNLTPCHGATGIFSIWCPTKVPTYLKDQFPMLDMDGICTRFDVFCFDASTHLTPSSSKPAPKL